MPLYQHLSCLNPIYIHLPCFFVGWLYISQYISIMYHCVTVISYYPHYCIVLYMFIGYIYIYPIMLPLIRIFCRLYPHIPCSIVDCTSHSIFIKSSWSLKNISIVYISRISPFADDLRICAMVERWFITLILGNGHPSLSSFFCGHKSRISMARDEWPYPYPIYHPDDLMYLMIYPTIVG